MLAPLIEDIKQAPLCALGWRDTLFEVHFLSYLRQQLAGIYLPPVHTGAELLAALAQGTNHHFILREPIQMLIWPKTDELSVAKQFQGLVREMRGVLTQHQNYLLYPTHVRRDPWPNNSQQYSTVIAGGSSLQFGSDIIMIMEAPNLHVVKNRVGQTGVKINVEPLLRVYQRGEKLKRVLSYV